MGRVGGARGRRGGDWRRVAGRHAAAPPPPPQPPSFYHPTTPTSGTPPLQTRTTAARAWCSQQKTRSASCTCRTETTGTGRLSAGRREVWATFGGEGGCGGGRGRPGPARRHASRDAAAPPRRLPPACPPKFLPTIILRQVGGPGDGSVHRGRPRGRRVGRVRRRGEHAVGGRLVLARGRGPGQRFAQTGGLAGHWEAGGAAAAQRGLARARAEDAVVQAPGRGRIGRRRERRREWRRREEETAPAPLLATPTHPNARAPTRRPPAPGRSLRRRLPASARPPRRPPRAQWSRSLKRWAVGGRGGVATASNEPP